MDGADDVRLGQAELGQRQGCARADHLGAEHVVVQHVHRTRFEKGEDSRQRGGIVRLVHHVHVRADRADPPDRRSVRERDHIHVETRVIQLFDQVLDVNLGATARAAGHQLGDDDSCRCRSFRRLRGFALQQDAEDRLVYGAPLVLVALLAAQEVEAPPAGIDPILEIERHPGHAR